MSKIRILNALCGAALVCLSLSCVETIALNTDGGRELVVNCILKEGEEQTLELFWTGGLSDDGYDVVKDAEIVLLCDYEPVAEFIMDESGVWKDRHTPKCGGHYRLDIKVGDREITADTIFPEDISVDTYGRWRWADKEQNLDYTFYSYELRIYDEFMAPHYGRECLSASHLWIFPRDLGWGAEYQRYIATSHQCADDFNAAPLSVRDLPCFSPDSISALPKWLRSEVAWIPEMLGDLQMHERFVRIDIPARYHNGKTQEELTDTPIYTDKSFALVRPIPVSESMYWKYSGPYEAIMYDVYILSEEADKYYKDVYRRHLNKDNFVFEYDTENVYTNIHGGIGVFGAMEARANKPGIWGYLGDKQPKE